MLMKFCGKKGTKGEKTHVESISRQSVKPFLDDVEDVILEFIWRLKKEKKWE